MSELPKISVDVNELGKSFIKIAELLQEALDVTGNETVIANLGVAMGALTALANVLVVEEDKIPFEQWTESDLAVPKD